MYMKCIKHKNVYVNKSNAAPSAKVAYDQTLVESVKRQFYLFFV